MYNNERKTRFLDNLSSEVSVNGFTYLFRNSEEMEEKYGADLCEFSTEQFRSLMETYGSNEKTSRTIKTRISRYVKWCIEQGMFSGDTSKIKAVKTSDVFHEDSIKNKYISSPAQLRVILDNCFDPTESGTSDVIYRTCLWMLFAGVDIYAAMQVKKKDVDLFNRKFLYDGQYYPIYEYGFHDFQLAKESTQFWYKHPNYSSGGVFRNRKNSEYLLSGVRTEQYGYYDLIGLVDKPIRKKMGLSISSKTVLQSGVFYRAYELEIAGLCPDFSQYITSRLKETMIENADKMSDKSYSEYLKNRGRILLGETKTNYAHWKKVFYK